MRIYKTTHALSFTINSGSVTRNRQYTCSNGQLGDLIFHFPDVNDGDYSVMNNMVWSSYVQANSGTNNCRMRYRSTVNHGVVRTITFTEVIIRTASA